MSFPAVSDFIFSDLLSEHNLKPIWEKVRGYSFAGTAASALALLYLTISGVGLHCLPSGKNGTDQFSTSQAAHVNTLCSYQIPFAFSYCGATCLAMATIILILSTYWLHLPGVSGSFCTFAEVDKNISSSQMTLDEVKNGLQKVMKNTTLTDCQQNLRNAFMMLWSYQCASDIKNAYKVRCYLLGTFLAISAAVSIYFLAVVGKQDDQVFQCCLNESLKYSNKPRVNEIFDCGSNLTWRLFVLILIFLASVFAQAIAILWGLYRTQNFCCRSTSSPAESIRFMATFWKFSRPTRSGILHEFVEHLSSQNLLTALSSDIEKVLYVGDVQFVVRYFNLGGLLFDRLKYVIETADERKVLQLEQTILQVLREIEYDIVQCEGLITAAKERQCWGLLAAALDYCKYPQNENFESLLLCGLNFDSISFSSGMHVGETLSGSLLYYALSGKYRTLSEKFTAARFLLCNARDGRVKYVHFQGISMTLKEFQSEYFPQKTEIVDICDKPEKYEGAPASLSQDKMLEIARRYSSVRNNGGYVCRALQHLKFSRWDSSATDISRLSEERRHWNVFASLLNAFIVTKEERSRLWIIDACAVRTFPFQNPDFWKVIIDNSKAWPQRKKCFIPNAARHIIACSGVTDQWFAFVSRIEELLDPSEITLILPRYAGVENANHQLTTTTSQDTSSDDTVPSATEHSDSPDQFLLPRQC